MKIKHVLIGFLAMAFVMSIVLQAPLNAWAQNLGKWYGNQGNTVWTLASGGTITANSGSTVTLAGTNTLSGTTGITGAATLSGATTTISSATTTLSGTAIGISGATTTFSGAAINFTKATSKGAVTSNGLYLWTFSAGDAGTVTFADTLAASHAFTLTGPMSSTKLLTLSGGVTSSGPLFQHSGVARFTGGTKLSGADTLASTTLRIDPFMTYSKCGMSVVDADQDTAYIYVPGLAATDAVFAMTAEDTANAVVRSFVEATNWLTVHVAGAVTSDNSDGMKISWFAIRPQ